MALPLYTQGKPVWIIWRSENSWPYQDSTSNLSVVRPVASHCTDCTFMALGKSCMEIIYNWDCWYRTTGSEHNMRGKNLKSRNIKWRFCCNNSLSHTANLLSCQCTFIRDAAFFETTLILAHAVHTSVWDWYYEAGWPSMPYRLDTVVCPLWTGLNPHFGQIASWHRCGEMQHHLWLPCGDASSVGVNSGLLAEMEQPQVHCK
jgi:hypothetical protein